MSSFPWSNNDVNQVPSKKQAKGQEIKSTCPWASTNDVNVVKPTKTDPSEESYDQKKLTTIIITNKTPGELNSFFAPLINDKAAWGIFFYK